MSKRDALKTIKITQMNSMGDIDKEFVIDLPEKFFTGISMFKRYFIHIGDNIYRIDKNGKLHKDGDVTDFYDRLY